MATITWLQALVIWPAPASPIRVILLPSAWKTGSTRSNVALSPPTMIESCALMAPASPPLTGASSMGQPRSCACSASRLAVTGEMVLMSTRTAPGLAPSNTPFEPAITSSTSGPSGSMVITTSDSRTHSAGLSALRAPAATSSSTAGWLRLWTVSW